MEVFTYLRRISSLQILSKFVLGMESYTPKLLKYVTLRALNLENQNGLNSKIQSEDLNKILKVVKSQILKVKSSEWTLSDLVSVMSFLASLESNLDEKTTLFLTDKMRNLDQFNLYDMIQLLKSQKKLKIPIDTQIVLSHIKNNINTLLKSCSVPNIYSILNALLEHNLTLDLSTLVSIFQHLEQSNLINKLNFKDLTNLYNSVSRHIKLVRNENKYNSEQDYELNLENYHKVESFLKLLYSNVLNLVSSEEDDFEGIVDVVDSLVNSNSSHIDHESYSELVQSSEVLFTRSKYHLKNTLQNNNSVNLTKGINPKDLKVLLRNMVALNWDDQELIYLILSNYNETCTKWSLQGNIDILRSVVYFGFHNQFSIEKWMKCVNKFSKILTPRYINEVFILLAMYNSIYKCGNFIDFFVQSDLIGEDELRTGFHILLHTDESILNKLSLKSLNKLNSLDFGLFSPNLYILSDDSENVGKVVQELYDKFTFSQLNLNLVKFCKFVSK